MWIATIFGYVSPEMLNIAALNGENLSNRFFKIGSFGSEFANFNVGLFGYLAYIYLPLLLIVLYRFYDDTSYSFKKVRLTFGYILLFICLLILQALMFKVGFFGTFICDLLEPYIKIFGIYTLVFLGIIASFFIISQKRMLYILEYLGETNKMFKKSLSSFLKEAGKKLKDIYVDFNMDYLQRANKKMLNLQYSEIVTMPKSKYTFECKLVEPPLDSYAKHPQNMESVAFENFSNGDLKQDLQDLQNDISENNELENLDKNAILDSTNTNVIESNNIKIKTNTQKSFDSGFDITKISYLNENFRSVAPKNESEGDDVLKRFQKANTHIKVSGNDNFAFNETKENVTIKLKDSKNHNVLESFISPKSLAIKEEWLREDLPQTNNEQSSNITIKKVSKNETLESNNNALNKEIKTQINLIKNEENSILTNNLESKDKPQITLKSKDGSKINDKKDFIVTLRENSVQFIKPVKRENLENSQLSNSENSKNMESNLDSNIEAQRVKNIENKKIKLSNMPLESSYKVMNMDFTRQNNKEDSKDSINDNILDENLQNIESNNSTIIENRAPSEILSEVLIQEIAPANTQDSITQDSIKDFMQHKNNENEQEIIIMPLESKFAQNVESKDFINSQDSKEDSNQNLSKVSNISQTGQTSKITQNAPITLQNITQDSNQNITKDYTQDLNQDFTQSVSQANKDFTQDFSQDSIKDSTQSFNQDSTQSTSQNHTSFYLPNEIPTMPIFNNLDSRNITDSITFPTFSNFSNNIESNMLQNTQNKQNIESVFKDSITESITLKQKNSTNHTPNIQITTQNKNEHSKSNKQEVPIITRNERDKQEVPDIQITAQPQIITQSHKKNTNYETNIESTSKNITDSITFNLKNLALQTAENKIAEKPTEPYVLPPITLLQVPKNQDAIDDSEIDSKIENLLAKMRVFKIRGDIVNVSLGPVVTTFEFRPEADVKVNKVLGLQDDLAMSLKARNIRIQAPIPGKDVIGIEIPNNEAQTIYLRDILESSAFKNNENALSIVLGKDIIGAPVIENLARLPHLLVAGTTGSGKSVGVNTLILSLLYRNSPENLKLIMIDPKKVEFAPYEDLPHLITPIINSPTAAIKALQVAVTEMYKRYELLKESKTKTILTYNEKSQEKMPYFVIIIDELAELMATGGKEAEGAITQIAQMGRAAGMHLIIATQRSSTNVVTGTLKANLPARLSYRVGNMVDSKVVIDSSGAERLLGNGDGLFVSPQGISRVHSPWVSEGEIEDIVSFIREQREPNYDSRFIEEDSVSVDVEASATGGSGDLITQAKQIMLRDQKTSVSYLQRQLGIGFNKAANIADQLEKEGFLSAPNSKGKREILG